MRVPMVEEVWLQVAGRPVACHVLELGLACCGIEMREARRTAALAGSLTADGAGELPGGRPDQAQSTSGPPVPPAAASAPAPLNVLVVAGTVTVELGPVVQAALADVPEPRAVLAFGACATTGGPYWDSYAVLPGAHEVVEVHAWVAGCPPRSADLLAGLEALVRGLPDDPAQQAGSADAGATRAR